MRNAHALSAVLEKNASLTDLQLWNNNIGNEGAERIGAALEKNAVLTSLNLGENNLREGAAASRSIAPVWPISQTRPQPKSHSRPCALPWIPRQR